MKAPVFDTKGNESDVYSSEIPAEFQKLERFVARKAVVAAVDALGLLEEIKPHDLTVPYGDRGGVVIEPMLTDQWYVRADVLAKPAVEAVENGDIQFVPKRYETCISLDARYSGLVYLSSAVVGSPYPAWYDEAGNVYVGRNEEEVRKENNLGADVALRQDEDVLDTVLFCAVDLLYPRLAGKHRRTAPVPPNQRDGIWFRHHFLLDCPHDHDDHALHQR